MRIRITIFSIFPHPLPSSHPQTLKFYSLSSIAKRRINIIFTLGNDLAIRGRPGELLYRIRWETTALSFAHSSVYRVRTYPPTYLRGIKIISLVCYFICLVVTFVAEFDDYRVSRFSNFVVENDDDYHLIASLGAKESDASRKRSRYVVSDGGFRVLGLCDPPPPASARLCNRLM